MSNKWMKAAAAFVLSSSLLVPQFAFAAGDSGKVTVKVRLVGTNGLYKERYVQVGGESFTNTVGDKIALNGATPMGALIDLLQTEGLKYEAKTASFGSYVTSIGGTAEKTINDKTGWGLWIDGKAPSVGGDQAQLQNGDEVTWAFYDYDQSLYPQITVSTAHPNVGDKVTVKVTAEKTTYDANWTATTTTVPVDGATVHVKNDEELYTTDKDGSVTLPAAHAGLMSFYVDKVQEGTTLPLAIRTTTENLLVGQPNATFPDLNGYGWAKTSIGTLASKGLVVGDVAGHYNPLNVVTRGELATVLSMTGDLNLGGLESFSDVTAANPFHDYILTANRQGYLTGDGNGHFNPMQAVSRQDLAVVLSRYLSLPAASQELSFRDKGMISSYATSAVKAVSKAGLMVGEPNGTFRPLAPVTRAEMAVAVTKALQVKDAK